jgi:hypothetical protein
LAKSSAFFSKTVPKNETQCKKRNTVPKFIDYLGFLIGLKYETTTKIAMQ